VTRTNPTEGTPETLDQLLTGLTGENRAYIEELYADWVESPVTVHPEWRTIFERMGPPTGVTRREDVVGPAPTRRSIFGGREAATTASRAEHSRKNAAVLQLISNYRRIGHLAADLDPLGLRERRSLPQLGLAYHGLSDDDLETTFHVGRLAGPTYQSLREIVQRCERIYCRSVAIEYAYIRDEARRRWLERRIEEAESKVELDRKTALRVLEKMGAADHLETFIQTKYLGQKRFSVEGGEAVIPLLDLILDTAAELGAKEAVIGMAHRGRLNVLANILGKSAQDIFEEFDDQGEALRESVSGDVKYHLGFSSDVTTASGRPMHLSLAFNPSHLEFVAPVVVGQVRAKQDHFGDEERKQALPIIIHGDSAIAGQGVAVETINMARLKGYRVGGSIHVVINNQIGFTTPPESSRSSAHCTDVAKVILPPVLHVNSDDLGAVAFAARLAGEYRQTFGDDVFIDLWCYRKFGHNEGDEPAFTNPVMVQAIKKRPTPLQKFVAQAVAKGVLTKQDLEQVGERIRGELEDALAAARDEKPTGALAGLWKGMHLGYDPAAVDRPTGVPADRLRALTKTMATFPKGLAPHRKIAKVYADRVKMAAGELPIDWGMAEGLAFASLLADGYGVRLSGQDAGRGTFAHRHAVVHDQKGGKDDVPLTRLGDKQGTFEVIDSPLSEAAVLGFDYGYSLVRPDALVIWEAQFGDFANGAQVLIDQFVCSSEAKWGRSSGLVMLLPHGYEGMGPEHSSARLERFLQLSGDDNWYVMNLTTPAQIFHALRRQLRRTYRKPLVVMTPKSLLKHRLAVSTMDELADGGFRPVIDDVLVADRSGVQRVVLCSGKVYYELHQALEASEEQRIAVVRVEQLYPLPVDELRAVLALYPAATELVWCQEEPRNMGAWHYMLEALGSVSDLRPRYVGRRRSASPATGSKKVHVKEQNALVEEATSVP
jgi:2-oxoglutarate dehydrogenase E1 component